MSLFLVVLHQLVKINYESAFFGCWSRFYVINHESAFFFVVGQDFVIHHGSAFFFFFFSVDGQD